MDLKLQLSNEQLQAALHAAMLDALGTEGRDALMKGAIEYMTTKKERGHYGQKERSPLEDAFYQAIYALAQQTANEWIVSHPEVQAEVVALVGEAWARLLADREKVVDKIARAIGDALSNTDR